MTDKERIERIAKLLNELSLDDITSTEFDEVFPKQSINDIKDELWRMYCFASDVCDTINMGDTAEQEPCVDSVSALNRVMEYTYGMLTAEKAGLQHLIKSMLDELPSINPQEPKTGKWLRTGETDVYYDLPSYECDKCGQYSLEKGKYCPNCGVTMSEVEE